LGFDKDLFLQEKEFIMETFKEIKPVISARFKLWRRQPVVKRLVRPTRIDRARALGYRAKQGFVVVRTRIKKGSRRRPTIRKGRKPRSMGLFFNPTERRQAIAERRVARDFPNLEVLNSYYVGEDGKYKFFEVIMVDKHHPVIKADKNINWIVNQRRRVFRGRTAASRKARDLN
jgi:large subunit ribosomal protein L15e